MGKNKNIQMDFSKRKVISEMLSNESNATEISSVLGIHKSTVSREIKNYRYLSFKGERHASLCSSCLNVKICNYKHKCGKLLCSAKCVGCKLLKVCDRYKEIKCNIENHFPFVCNSCVYSHICMKNHYLYDARKANEAAGKIRKESREGINLTLDEYKVLNNVVSSGIEKGQSIYHILKSTDVGKCLKTVYNYINTGKLDVKPIDLPRAVTLKKRKCKIPSKYEYNENKNVDRKHRTYADWLVFQAENRIIIYWQMDFLGAPHKSQQQILTLTIPQFEFVYLIPIEYPNNSKIVEIFNLLEEMLGDDFTKVFEAILTDRDVKFNCFSDIEVNTEGVIRTHIFFCNPSASNEKPSVENFNQQIRAIFKKGVLLSNITFKQCNEISSNLNSRFLNSIDGVRPCDLFIKYFGYNIFQKLNLKVVDPKEVKIINFKKY